MLTRRQFLFSLLAGNIPLQASSSILGPWLQDLQPRSATLLWCGRPEDNLLRWEMNGQEFRLNGQPTTLADGRQIFRCRVPLEPTSRPDNDLCFLALGDSGTGSEEQSRLFQRLEAEPADLLLHTGDLAYPLATDQTLEDLYIRPYARLMSRIPFYPCPGNHDAAISLDAYLRWHSLPDPADVPAADRGRYYCFQSQGVDFYVLDSNDALWEGQRMLQWLDRQLAASRAFWRIALFHHPPYTGGKHAADETCRLAAAQLAPRLEAARVPLVLNGHEHSYQRFARASTAYVVSGGGGAGLYSPGQHPDRVTASELHHYVRGQVNGSRLHLAAIGLNGERIDEFTLSPPPVIRSVVDSAAFGPRLAPGGLASLFGYHLAAGRDGIRLSLDGQPLPLGSSSGSQLNFVLPRRAPGLARLELTTPNGSTSYEMELLPSAPSLFRDEQGVPVSERLASGHRIFLTGSGGKQVRLRSGLKDLGPFLPRPVPALPGVEQIEIALPFPMPALSVEAA
ncbi:MAG: metallophosphoesterase [Acidobacteriota bacterium]